MTWLDTLLARGDEAKRADTVPLAPARQSAKPRPRADIKAVSVQTAAPFGVGPTIDSASPSGREPAVTAMPVVAAARRMTCRQRSTAPAAPATIARSGARRAAPGGRHATGPPGPGHLTGNRRGEGVVERRFGADDLEQPQLRALHETNRLRTDRDLRGRRPVVGDDVLGPRG